MFGTIESLNSKKDAVDRSRKTFGFIVDGDGQTYFFLPTSMEMTSPVQFDGLKAGMKVEFRVIEHPKGPRAIEVRALNGGERNS